VTVDVFPGTTATGTPERSVAATTDGLSHWTATVTPELAEGTWTARARQTDHAGHTGYSEARTFVVDLSPPEPFALRGPADGAFVDSEPLGLTWDAADDASGVSHYVYTLVHPTGTSSDVVHPSSCSGGSCLANLSALPEGQYSWSVRAHDRHGHTRDSATHTFVVDDTPPSSFALLAPPDGQRSQDRTPSLSWEPARDDAAGVANYDVWLDGRLHADDVTATEVEVSEPLGDGPHHWFVVAEDRAGNRRTSNTQPFSVDTTPPAAALAAPARVSTGADALLDASGSEDAYGGRIVRHEWDLDGDGTFERDTGATPTTTVAYPAPGDQQPAVRVTDGVGLSAIGSAPVSVRRAPPAGFPGVSINGGAQYTNDRDVTLDVVWLPFTTGFVISNDGGFRDAQTLPVAQSVPWRLDDSGLERLPRTIYLRFAGVDGARETYQDDIILDQTAPRLLRARRVGRASVRLRARDNVSGVARMQLTTNRRRPGRERRFRARTTFAPRVGAPVFVRVRDGAGNWSGWRRAAQR
ncbi:MAG: Ig-like domain-containing protein, partial [Actinomycetota bacterium]|nr:Ig-like domain-containing protein [Actinomycetota bacterium]